MVSKSFTLDQTVLLKLLLHAAKFPSAAVNGLLLGTVTQAPAGQANGSPPSSPRGSALARELVTVVDAIPLFHSHLQLVPLLEVALVQVDAYARERKLQLVGYYQANEKLDDITFSATGRKIADKLQQRCPQACAVVVDNRKLGTFLKGTAPGFLELYTKDTGKGWQHSAGSEGGTKDGQAPVKLTYGRGGDVPGLYVEYVGEGRHRTLADFEDHVDDISRDWLNAELLS